MLQSLIETVAPPSFESLSRLSSATSIAHAGNLMNTHHGLGSAQSEQGFASNPFQAEVPEGLQKDMKAYKAQLLWQPRFLTSTS